MHLAELKQKSIGDLNDVARELKIEGGANLRKQELRRVATVGNP